MAYRGDTTDPLEVIIGQRRMHRQVILVLVVLWIVPMLFNGGFSISQMVMAPPQPTASQPSRPAPGIPGEKMSPQALERYLVSVPASTQPPQDVRCGPGAKGWDYICSYRERATSPSRLKIGVRVSATAVVQASAPHRFESVLAGPAGTQ